MSRSPAARLLMLLALVAPAWLVVAGLLGEHAANAQVFKPRGRAGSYPVSTAARKAVQAAPVATNASAPVPATVTVKQATRTIGPTPRRVSTPIARPAAAPPAKKTSRAKARPADDVVVVDDDDDDDVKISDED